MNEQERIALITGATAGIGEATARALAAAGFNLIIAGRRGNRLRALAGELETTGTAVLPLCLDVRDREAVRRAFEGLPARWTAIDVLVNNAGLAVGTSPLQEGVVDDWERMIDTNVKGLLYVTREVAPLMIKRRRGHIVNLASIAGKEVYPGGNVYCATKHAVDALSRAARVDLVKHGVKVTNVAPGMVETEFSLVRYKGDAGAAAGVYAGFEPLAARDVAEVILFAVTRPPRVCLNDIVIMPAAQASARDVHKE